MNEHDTHPANLSPEGLRRRERIGRELAERARHRHTGRRALAAAAMLALAATAFIALRSLTPQAPTRPIVQAPPERTSVPVVAPAPAPATHPTIQITIVSNSPIPDRPCSESPPLSSDTIPICILDDTSLLQVLSETGQSYGLVKVAGRTEVVRNTP
jgi:hypothetical protein